MELGSRKSTFKFFNVIADHDDFRCILDEHWGMVYHQNSLLNIWCKLKHMKESFKQINTTYLRNTPEKLSQLRKALEQT